MDAQTILERVQALSDEFACSAPERRLRRGLDRADFARLAQAGFLLSGVPSAHGGIWEGSGSARPVAEMLRVLAHADSSLALVAAMHPAVIAFGGWLTLEEAPAPYAAAWAEQREWVFDTAKRGEWWGTITSEPGSGGDVLQTKAIARPAGEAGCYLLSGDKHFGSGSGVMSYMITTALPEGEAGPDMFFMDVRGVPWDGTAGVTLFGAPGCPARARRRPRRRAVYRCHRRDCRNRARHCAPPARAAACLAASLRAGGVGARRAGRLADRAGVRGRAARR
jgi:alkylation response protein AidB-like acyl-CoA dehydrogenase